MNNTHKTSTITAWLSCISAAFFFFYTSMIANCFNTFSLHLLKDLAINATQLGILSASYLLAYAFSLVPAGFLLDNYSIRKLVLSANCMAILLLALFSQIHSYRAGILIIFLLGISSSMSFIAPMKLVRRWFVYKHIALLSGIIVAFAMLGGIMANLPLMWLTLITSWRTACFLMAGLGLLFLILQWLWLCDGPSTKLSTPPLYETMTLSRFARILTSPILLGLGTYNSLLNLPLTLFGAEWGVIYLMQSHQLSSLRASAVVSMVFLGMLVGAPLLGFIADNYFSHAKTMMLSAALSLLTILILIFTPHLHFFSLMALIFLLGFFSGSQSVGYAAATSYSPPQRLGISLSIVSVIVMSMGTLLQPLFGYLLTVFWDGMLYNGNPRYSPADFIRAMSIYVIGFAVSLIISLFFSSVQRQDKCIY